MVSFDTHYRHLGRALAANRRIIYGIPGAIVLLGFANPAALAWYMVFGAALLVATASATSSISDEPG